jgi:hypothetical protein
MTRLIKGVRVRLKRRADTETAVVQAVLYNRDNTESGLLWLESPLRGRTIYRVADLEAVPEQSKESPQ